MSDGYIRWVVTTPVQGLDMKWHYVALFFRNLGIDMVCCTMILEYVFRYLMICRRYTMTKWNISIVLVVCLLFFGYVAYSGAVSVKGTTESFTDDELNQIFGESVWKINGTLMKGTVINKSASGRTTFILFFTIRVLITYCIIIYCSVTVRHKLSSHKTMSVATRRLQKGMDKIMLVQAIILTVSAVIPMYLQAYILHMQYNFIIRGTIQNLCYSWMSALKPVSTLYFVIDYRKRFRRTFKCYSFALVVQPRNVSVTRVSTITT